MYSKKKTGIIALIIIILLAVILGGVFYVKTKYTIQTVYVEGNVHYSEEQIKEIVMDGPFGIGNNSLYLSMKYRNRGVKNIPFVDVMDVNILAPDTIKIIVYEKMLTGYVKFLDSYMYFDKDGCVIESSSIQTAGVPQITGLKFDSIVLGQTLPVENMDVFSGILSITKLIHKYELSSDRLHFNQSGEITAYFGDVKVTLGDEESTLENRIMILPKLLESLEGKRGTLQMATYDESGKYIFKPE